MKDCTCYDEGLHDRETGLALVHPERFCKSCEEHRAKSSLHMTRMNAISEQVRVDYPGWDHKTHYAEVKRRFANIYGK